MGKAVKAVTKNPLRSLAAVGTLGGSELALKAGEKLGLKLGGEEGAYVTPEEQQKGLYNAFASDYDNQMGLADKGVQQSGLTKDLYGDGGLQSQLAAEQRQLSGQGFALTPEDMTAYGQASGDIARQFGQQEQDVSKSLARRGLGGASSGAAGAAFSGLAGNKNEMLAKAQTDIAQKRYQDTQNRLQNVRSQMQSLGTQGAGLAQQRFADKGDNLARAAGLEMKGNEQQRQALADKEAAYKPGLLGTIGQGLQSGIGQVASRAPGAAVGGLFG